MLLFLEHFQCQKLHSCIMKQPSFWHRARSLASTDGEFYFYLLSFLLHLTIVLASTNSQDAASMSALANQWKNKPSNWIGNDPCDGWIGISCSNSRIVSITLSSLGITETLPGDIQFMEELQSLDLSYNPGLKGSLPPSIGKMKKLVNLVLIGCSFSGEIPPEIGSLENLVFLSLNSNSFTGSIPATIGNLSNLYWLDLADNKLTGTIPVSNGKKPGLDMLTHTKHFHFSMNQLSGTIPSKLFSSRMVLIHLLLDRNNLEGGIPSTLGQVKSLEVVRLDGNSLTGSVPTNLNSLTNVVELYLSNNKLVGPLPNLTGMNVLSYFDMSNNSFDPSDVPPWFSTLPSLTTLILENLGIRGEVPRALFAIYSLQTVRLRDNRFNGTLDLGTDYSNQLQLVDLQNNQIDQFTIGGGYNNTLILVGNPVCNKSGISLSYCRISQETPTPYSTPARNCLIKLCPPKQDPSPNCVCAYPFTGTLFFRAPSFSDLTNTTTYEILESKLESSFQDQQLPVDSVSLHNPFLDSNSYVEMTLQVFPSADIRFNQSAIALISFTLSNQTFKPPKMFGPYYFMAQQYEHFLVDSPNKKKNKGPLIIGAAAGAAVLLLVLALISVLLIRQMKKSKATVEQSRSYVGSRDPSRNSGSAPQLKGARWFSFDELKKCTNGFSQANEIGTGGYGKVYRGILNNGQLVAVKRAQEVLHGEEFKNEVELLSRVHHINLVSLAGFCFDQGEQMLVYEYITNGSLKDSLSGQSGVRLDWKRRLRIALGSAKGLAYLHELANPPIVHRDVKSSNILLDNHLNAKVSDFGLSKPLGDGNKSHVTTQVKGTIGYLDPEYYMTQQLTEKSDVYSFGVLLLEIITGKKPIDRGRYVVREVKLTMDKTKDLYGLHGVLDPALGLGTISGLENFVDLALLCVEELGEDRPTMGEVVKELENIMHLAGINPNYASSSASLSGEGPRMSRHPYDNEAFNYSGGPPSSRIEPK